MSGTAGGARRGRHLCVDGWAQVCTSPSFVFAGTMLVYGLALAARYPTLGFLPDGWTLLELARSFERHTPYVFNTYRSFVSEATRYSAAFPPAFPWLLFVVRRISPGSEVAGVAINLLIAALTPLLLGIMSRASGRGTGPGVLAGVLLVIYVPYSWEVLGGRSIPLAVLTCLVALGLAQRSVTAASGSRERLLCAALAGCCAGLACLVRFDTAAFALGLGVAIGFLARSPIASCGYGLGLLIGIAPWVLFSWTHFHHLWFSDNAWVAASADPAYVIDYPARSARTLASDPLRWLVRCSGNLLPAVQSLGASLARNPGLCILFATALLAGRTHTRPAKDTGVEREPSRLYRLAPWIALAGMAPQLAVGYFDHRYWSLTFAVTGFALALRLPEHPDSGPTQAAERTARWLAAAFLLGLAAALGHWGSWAIQRREVESRIRREDEAMAVLASCVVRAGNAYALIDDAPFAARFGARYGLPTVILPTNWARLDPAQRAAFARRFDPLLYLDLPGLLRLKSTSDCPALRSAAPGT